MLEASNERPNKFSLYILGAGFSRAAGLPLAAELWPEVCRRALRLQGRASQFRRDLEYFIAYKKNCDGVSLNYTSVDFEQFLGFLDIEHHLGLRGSDTWSDDGNESQIVVKTLIGQILTERTPKESDIPDIYIRFAKGLRPHDIVLTFNYDILLERALDVAGIPYRLVADRYTSVDRFGALIDAASQEIIILKVHGSLDWFDRRLYSEIQNDRREIARKMVGVDLNPHHPIFNASPSFDVVPIVQGPCFPEDPLSQIYRVKDIERLYANPSWFEVTPHMLNPSTAKVCTRSGSLCGVGWLEVGLRISKWS